MMKTQTSRLANSIAAFVLVVFTTLGCLNAATLTTIHSFDGSDGANPYAGLVQGTDGNFYGTTTGGGTANSGVVFKISASGTFTLLHSFTGADGSAPWAGLAQGTNGDFYGVASKGGTDNWGTAFKITSTGTFTQLYDFVFGGVGGVYPLAALVRGDDGNFYGDSNIGGVNGFGAVFRLSPAGGVMELHSFSSSDGAAPRDALFLADDGNFYGTTPFGGTTTNNCNCGTVFRITPDGAVTTLHSFSDAVHGGPWAGLAQGSDGNFYGTTLGGGTANKGTVFKITAEGALTTVYNFNGGVDGGNPLNHLVLASDNNLYGTADGGEAGLGVVFKVTPSGAVSTVASFGILLSGTGWSPQAPLVQGTDGNLYGTTVYGGANFKGTVFKLTIGGGGGSSTTVNELLDAIEEVVVDPKLAGKLTKKASKIGGVIAAGKTATACKQLAKFTTSIDKLQAKGKLTAEQADAIITSVATVTAALGC